MSRHLPPFAALRAFEAAACHGNFKQAAEFLCLSSSAVSHQVRSLEEFLGVQLFHREKGKPQLTSAGAAYLEEIQDIFERLRRATTAVGDRNKRPSLVLHMFHSLASCWLLPLLPNFKKKYPNFDIKLLSGIEPVEFSSDDIDAGIRYGDGSWRGLRSDFLMEDELFLVCNPEMARKLPPAGNLEQLSETPLIHCSLDPTEWGKWLAAANTSFHERQNWLDLDSRGLVLEAAAGGLGIAIGRLPYVTNYLNNGRLVEPYSIRVNTGKAYYLVYPEHHASYDTVMCLRTWLLDVCTARQALGAAEHTLGAGTFPCRL